MSAAAEQSESGAVLCWTPQGAGDFADLAWLVAEALGNAEGVRCLEVARRESRLSAHVWTTGPEYVRAAAARCSWELYEPDAGYATTWGRLGEVGLTVVWISPADRG